MSLIDLILPKRRRARLCDPKKKLKILIRTNDQGKVEVLDASTGEILTGIGRVSFYVNILKQPCVEIEVRNVEFDIGVEEENVRIRQTGNQSNEQGTTP